MKKILLVFVCLFSCFVLVGCGKNGESLESVNANSLDKIYGKENLTIKDLDVIEQQLFPISYSYDIYHDGEFYGSGMFNYASDGSDQLLSLNRNIENKKVASSKLEDGMIHTVVDGITEDGLEISVRYINDSESLRYLAASVNEEDETTLYVFWY